MSGYANHFEQLAEAVRSLEIFPNVIKDFTSFLKQRYLKKHKPSDLVWVDKLCLEYKGNCKDYVKFIKRDVSSQFLGNCLDPTEDETGNLIEELKANINASNKRLSCFLGETDRKEVVEKLDGELSTMEAAKAKTDKKEKYWMKFSEWLKGKVLEHVGDLFAKVVGPLWDFVYTNASLAIQSDYDHEVLLAAVKKIHVAIPEMEKSLNMNQSALRGVDSILDVFAKMHAEKDPGLKNQMRYLYPMQNTIDNACDRITELVENLNE